MCVVMNHEYKAQTKVLTYQELVVATKTLIADTRHNEVVTVVMKSPVRPQTLWYTPDGDCGALIIPELTSQDVDIFVPAVKISDAGEVPGGTVYARGVIGGLGGHADNGVPPVVTTSGDEIEVVVLIPPRALQLVTPVEIVSTEYIIPSPQLALKIWQALTACGHNEPSPGYWEAYEELWEILAGRES